MQDLYDDAAAGKLPQPDVLEGLWHEWLWRLDCNEPVVEALGDMNESQALGLLLAVMSDAEHRDGTVVGRLLPQSPLVHLFPRPVAEFTLRELADQVECLQLSWGHVLSNATPDNARSVLSALMARMGHLAQHAYPEGEGTLDDQQHMTQLPGPQRLCIVSRKFLRQTCCTLLVLFRVMHVVAKAEVVPSLSAEDQRRAVAALQQHHIEASTDTFSILQQMVALSPGMRLAYRTNFAGMYNDVSQVVYFHNPKFARQPQMDLEDIPKSSIHTLPLVHQIMPDVDIFYDDDTLIPGLTGLGRPEESASKYCWLVTCGTVFLIECAAGGKILASPDATMIPLLYRVLHATGRLAPPKPESGALERVVAETGYSHVFLV